MDTQMDQKTIHHITLCAYFLRLFVPCWTFTDTALSSQFVDHDWLWVVDQYLGLQSPISWCLFCQRWPSESSLPLPLYGSALSDRIRLAFFAIYIAYLPMSVKLSEIALNKIDRKVSVTWCHYTLGFKTCIIATQVSGTGFIIWSRFPALQAKNKTQKKMFSLRTPIRQYLPQLLILS
jgi:hypothetical protein